MRADGGTEDNALNFQSQKPAKLVGRMLYVNAPEPYLEMACFHLPV